MIDFFINIDKLSLSYRSAQHGEWLSALQCVDLGVRDGEFVAIVGPSGCGKTSVLRIIGGLIERTDDNVRMDGTVQIGGMDPVAAKTARCFGFAFQNPVLLPWRTVRENVGLPLELLRVDESEIQEKVVSMLELMGVQDFADLYPRELSGGIQQRVNIAPALIHEPRRLLLDEPFGALDEVTRERLNIALLQIHRLKAATILFVTHSLREAAFLAQRIVVLSSRPASVRATITSPLPADRTEAILADERFLILLAEIKSTFLEGEPV